MSLSPKILRINTDCDDPAEALIVDSTNYTPKSLGTIVAGDYLDYVLIPLDSNGSSTVADSSSYNVKVGIGRYDAGTLAQSSWFHTSQSYGWTGSLNTNTASLTNVIDAAGSETYQASFEVILVRKTGPASGSQTTILQTPVTIRQQVLS